MTASSLLPRCRRRGRVRIHRPARSRIGGGRRSAMAALVPPISSPNGTPAGQADSQPRHWMQVSIDSNHSLSSVYSPDSASRMRAIRPLGERRSSPVAL